MKPARPSMKPAHPSLHPPRLVRRASGLRRASAAWLGLALAALLLAIGCARSPLERSLERGVAWFEAHVERADPSWASVIGYLERRFGFSLQLASGELVRDSADESVRPEIAALYRRLSDPGARGDARAIAALPSQIDRMTALSLYCDQLGLPPNWPELLQRASLAGGYALTHAALARAWTLENGCLPESALAALHSEQTDLLAALVARGDTQPDPKLPSTDQWIEALALLYYTGARERVRPEWIAALLAAQRDDGGWPARPNAAHSDPHATALALWVLLENLEPAAAPIRWIPRLASAAEAR